MIGHFVLALTTATPGVERLIVSRQVATVEKGAELLVTEAAPPVPARPGEVGIACRLGPGFHATMRTTQARSRGEIEKRMALTRSMTWHSLPNRARCAGRSFDFRPGGAGDFVTDIAVSTNGQLVGLRGGWQAGKLPAAGGDCFYRRVGAKSIPQGCVRLWVS